MASFQCKISGHPLRSNEYRFKEINFSLHDERTLGEVPRRIYLHALVAFDCMQGGGVADLGIAFH